MLILIQKAPQMRPFFVFKSAPYQKQISIITIKIKAKQL